MNGEIKRNLYYSGQKVEYFIDESDKGVFSFGSTDGGEITVYVVYDNNGDLIGFEKK